MEADPGSKAPATAAWLLALASQPEQGMLQLTTASVQGVEPATATVQHAAGAEAATDLKVQLRQ